MTESLHVTDAETVSLRLSAQVEAADELAAAAADVLGVVALHTRRRLRLALERYQAASEACGAGGTHTFSEHDETPTGPRSVIHCDECGAPPASVWAES